MIRSTCIYSGTCFGQKLWRDPAPPFAPELEYSWANLPTNSLKKWNRADLDTVKVDHHPRFAS